MNREAFHSLFVDLMANIHDAVVLDTHPMGEIFSKPAGGTIRQSRYLTELVSSEIDGMKPHDQQPHLDALEWRYYLILSKRFIQGQSMLELQNELSLGDRQLRRLQNRALLALENRLWDLAGFQNDNRLDEDAAEAETEPEFKPTLEMLSLNKILSEVIAIFQLQAAKEGVTFDFEICPEEVLVRVDRVILRQLILGLLEQAIQLGAGQISIRECKTNDQKVEVIIYCNTRDGAVPWDREDLNRQSIFMGQWFKVLNADFRQTTSPARTHFSLILSLPIPRQIAILVIDDHEPAIRLVQRALRQHPVKVFGETNPTNAISRVRSLMPDLILLDIMMTRVDGWEVLQMLKSDPDTSTIPVVINSVWDRPSLALSLGAYGFLKKPVKEEDLVDIIADLFHPDSLDGDSPGRQ